jgi:hypothetical protein
MNKNAAAGENAQGAQEFTLFIDGEEEIPEGVTVNVTTPAAKSGLEFTEGVENGVLTSNTVNVAFAENANPKAGTYKVKFTTGSGKSKSTYTLKLVVSSKSLTNGAVTFKTQAKMDLTTGQKMVLIPQLKGISGEIDDVEIDDTTNFAVEYNEDLKQIYLSPAEGIKLSTSTKYTVTVSLKVGGVQCSKKISFKPIAKKPTVKLGKISFVKAKIKDGTAEGKAGILASYLQNKKRFTIEPNEVTFYVNNNTPAALSTIEGYEDWYQVKNVLVKYDEESQMILVRPVGPISSGKLNSVKVKLNFNGKIVTKSLTFKYTTK